MKRKYTPILLFITILVTVAACTNTEDADETRENQATIINAYSYADYDKVIEDVYNNVADAKSRDVVTQINALSEYFLEAEYILGPLGEGEAGQFDQQPLYRTDAFDCVTYVETVIALANSNNLEGFKQHMLDIRYENDKPSFLNRNHFTSVDWNKNNIHKGYINDVTYKFTDESGTPVALVAETIINKPGWYQKFKANRLELLNPTTEAETEKLLDKLRNLANKVQQEQGAMLYIPLSKLFDRNGEPNQHLFDQIPHASIIDIIRPNWNLKKLIGTNLNVSHFGFAIRDNGELYYREASSVANKIIDVPLTEYLQQYANNPNSAVKGIAVLEITPLRK